MIKPRTHYLEAARASSDALRAWREGAESSLKRALRVPELGPASALPSLRLRGFDGGDDLVQAVAMTHLLADPGLRMLLGSLVGKVSVARGVPRGEARPAGFEDGPGFAAVLELLSRSDHDLATALAVDSAGLSTACDLVAAAVMQELWPGTCLKARDRDPIDVARSLVVRREFPRCAWPDHEGVRGVLEHPWFRGARRRTARSQARSVASGASVDWRSAFMWNHEEAPPDGLVAMAVEFHLGLVRSPCSSALMMDVHRHVDGLVRRSDSDAMKFWWSHATASAEALGFDAEAATRNSRTIDGALPLRHALPFRSRGSEEV
jgi:hypothetical protein